MTDDPNAVDEVRMSVPRGRVQVSSVADITRAVRLGYILFIFKLHNSIHKYVYA